MASGQRSLSGLCSNTSKAFRNIQARQFSASSSLGNLETTTASTPPPPPLPSSSTTQGPDPNLVSSARKERQLIRRGITPIGSRRRRAVIASLGKNAIPFEQLPYQCFQEARKVLLEDREEKLKQITTQRERIRRLEAQDVSATDGRSTALKERRLESMRQYLLELKVLADINDPVVKKRFEDGEGDMSKPIYRHLAEKKWRSMKRLIAVQRIEQFNLVPDLLQRIDPIMDLQFGFDTHQGRIIEPGAYVDSNVSETSPPVLKAQVFDANQRLVSIAIIDPDVPNVDKDSFDYRSHFLALNVPLSATTPVITLADLAEQHIVQPWTAPFAQKGSPYHRLAIVIFEQPNGERLNVAEVKKRYPKQHGFILRSFETKYTLKPIGATLFRTKYDDTMDEVMSRLGVSEAEMELRRKRVEPLPYKWTPKSGKRYR